MSRPFSVEAPSHKRGASRPTRLLLAFLVAAAVVGGSATLYAVAREDPALHFPGPAVLFATLLVAASTIGNLLLRFVRWHYLLRRLDVRLQTIPSLGAFAGSFAFLPVPLYLGQLVARSRLLTGVPEGRGGYVVLVFLWERALDVWALALLALLSHSSFPAAIASLLLLSVLLPPVRMLLVRRVVAATNYASGVLFEHGKIDASEVAPVLARQGFAVGAAVSLGCWLLTAAALIPLAHASGLELGPLQATSAAARSILLGALSLSPLGAGVSGFLLFDELTRILGPLADPSDATLVVFLYRAATAWLSVGIGAVALIAHRSVANRPAHADHFDDIDECYDTWLPEHVRDHVVGKKIAAMSAHLRTRPGPLRGLDIGCGRGWYLRELIAQGNDLVGLDTSIKQIEAAREYVRRDVPLVQGTVLGLPFAAGTFDFAYIINVLHHMPSREHQVRALQEIARTLRPGGTLFVHEFNVSNPLFRFYLSYIFPILKGIEEGTEPYMDPRALVRVAGLEPETIDFFSFTPDFVPAMLLKPATAVERFLESTPLVRYSAHFMAVLRRTDEAIPAADVEIAR